MLVGVGDVDNHLGDCIEGRLRAFAPFVKRFELGGHCLRRLVEDVQVKRK
jgi:hypothetical protein